jgi:hypothetical protein
LICFSKEASVLRHFVRRINHGQIIHVVNIRIRKRVCVRIDIRIAVV